MQSSLRYHHDARPPFHRVWSSGGSTLLEFPPAIGYGRLYLVNAYGDLLAMNTRTGKRAWRVQTHRCAASSPAISKTRHGTVYATLLNRGRCATGNGKDGEVIAVAHNWGQLRWRHVIGPSETSPLVVTGVGPLKEEASLHVIRGRY